MFERPSLVALRAVATTVAALACVCAFAAGPTVATDAAPQAGTAMDAKLRDTLIESAIEFSERPRPRTPIPAVLALTPKDFAREVCQDDNVPCDSVYAAYDAQRIRVLYRVSLDLAQVWERSFIVHELVHWLQHQARPDTAPDESCWGYLAAEREAYTVQNRFLRHHQSGRRAGTMMKMLHCEGRSGEAGDPDSYNRAPRPP